MASGNPSLAAFFPLSHQGIKFAKFQFPDRYKQIAHRGFSEEFPDQSKIVRVFNHLDVSR